MHRKQSIYVAVDAVLFSIIDGKLSTVLVKRLYNPFKWTWALPWGFALAHETLEQAMRREIREEIWVVDLFLMELKTFSEPERDPRDRVVSVLYLWIISPDSELVAGTDAEKVMFCPIDRLPPLAFDHKEMIMFARKYLVIQFWASALAQYFLPVYFSLTELQAVYQTIALREWEIRNFRKKILWWWVIKPTKKNEHSVWHRPARLYQFTNKRNYLLP